ncbi:hypothetical protein QZH41_019655, partial [Actinostola sp. cb2023]
MAASLPFVGTIDSDDEIEQLEEENDSEEEDEVRPKKKKTKKDHKKVFDKDFQFTTHDDFEQTSWNLEMAIKVAKKKESS